MAFSYSTTVSLPEKPAAPNASSNFSFMAASPSGSLVSITTRARSPWPLAGRRVQSVRPSMSPGAELKLLLLVQQACHPEKTNGIKPYPIPLQLGPGRIVYKMLTDCGERSGNGEGLREGIAGLVFAMNLAYGPVNRRFLPPQKSAGVRAWHSGRSSPRCNRPRRVHPRAIHVSGALAAVGGHRR